MAKERRKGTERRLEAVNHPQHYGGDTTYEVIKVLEAWGLDYDFCLANSVKYIARAGKKGTTKGLHVKADIADRIQDLEKGAWYLNRRIQRLKKMHSHLVTPKGRK